jgi:fatty acid desaturase
VKLIPRSEYAQALRPDLEPALFAPVPSRLLWLPLHLAVIALGTWAIARDLGGLLGAFGWSLLIGHSFAGCAFVAHETLHGATVRNRALRSLIGWVAFLPFVLSPRLWDAWHNRVHHGHTLKDGVDPDAFPTVATWERSRATRFADRVAFGANRALGWLTPILGFTGQSQQMLWRAQSHGILDGRGQRRAILETLAGMAVWASLGLLGGGHLWLFAYLLPLCVGNAVVMGYILTNHCLSPHTDVNDPLVNSLSVTTPALVRILHLNFGYHVEHHLFPSMSPRFAPRVRDRLVARWPGRYQSMPLLSALRLLLATPRCYRDATTLEDPLTGQRATALLPRDLPSGTAATERPLVELAAAEALADQAA